MSTVLNTEHQRWQLMGCYDMSLEALSHCLQSQVCSVHNFAERQNF
jgi:hypothetical protein